MPHLLTQFQDLQRSLPWAHRQHLTWDEHVFLMSHRIAPGNKGHFWFLQVGIKYLKDQDSKTTMLLGLASLTDILPNAIGGFAMHPLDKSSSLPPLTSNKPEDGFPGSAVLAFKYFMVKDKRNRQFNQQKAAPPP